MAIYLHFSLDNILTIFPKSRWLHLLEIFKTFMHRTTITIRTRANGKSRIGNTAPDLQREETIAWFWSLAWNPQMISNSTWNCSHQRVIFRDQILNTINYFTTDLQLRMTFSYKCICQSLEQSHIIYLFHIDFFFITGLSSAHPS